MAALLAFTVGTLLIALLRRPWRAVFGAERAYALWCALPVALGMTWLPHAMTVAMPPVVIRWISAATPATVSQGFRPAAAALSLDAWLGIGWVAGSAVWLFVVFWAQAKYARRLKDGQLITMPGTTLCVVTTRDKETGPALFGAWHPRIVLPVDFLARFDIVEQALVIRHESIHARRRDALWILSAHGLAAAFWFHPLGWWALRAFRQDQELACDAAVMREHPDQRRSYATAMLKTHDTLLLPIGCSWTSHHPLTERIAMLNVAEPSRRRRLAAFVALPVAMLVIAGAAYAASPTQPLTTAASPLTYQLTTHFAEGGAPLADVIVCLAEGSPATIRDTTKTGKDAWELMFNVRPATDNLLHVDVTTSSGEGDQRHDTHETLRGKAGETLSVRYAATADAAMRTLQVTPILGCPSAASAKVVQVNAKEHGTARSTALALAAQGGLTLLNPEALDEQPVGFNFEHLDAREAIRHVAEIDGRAVVIEGNNVRFATK